MDDGDFPRDDDDDDEPKVSTGRDFYALLSVKRDASVDDIKRAYRRLAQVAHPDKQASPMLREAAARDFNRLNEAYEVLIDKDRRRIYDVYGEAGLAAGLEVGHRHKTIAEISEEFERARAKEARQRMEAKLNFRGSYGFSFSAAHLFDDDIAQRRRYIAMKRGMQLGTGLDLNGMDFNSVFDVPLNSVIDERATGYVGAQGQMSRGMGAGGLILGMRMAASEHTNWELATVLGSNQSAATLATTRTLSEHTAGNLTYSYSSAQGGLGLAVGLDRQLFDEHTKGSLNWNVGPVSGMSTGVQRTKGKNSWKMDLSVGPASTGLTGFFARRWSKKTSFRFGFRAGTMALDVDIGSTRKIGPESAIGMSVSVGIRGVHLKLRFNHSGQRFSFPILISPYQRLTPTLVICSLTVPWTIVAAVDRYLVSPVYAKKEARRRAKLRERHKESVTAAKAEAAEAAEMLQRDTEKRTEKERSSDGLVIEAAVFGNFPERGKPKVGEPIVVGWGSDAQGVTTAGDRGYVPWLDVTTPLRFQVFDSSLDMHEGLDKTSMLGFCDPCPGEDKRLRVRYRYRGRMCEVTVGDDDALALPNKSHELPEAWNKGD